LVRERGGGAITTGKEIYGSVKEGSIRGGA